MDSSETRTFLAEGHSKEVMSSLNDLRHKGHFCDVTIHLKEKRFLAHRCVLSSCSPYFDNLIQETDHTMSHVTIQSAQHEAFEQLLNFIYTGKLVVREENACSFLRFATLFTLPKLNELCQDFLKSILSVKKCFFVKDTAKKFSLSTLEMNAHSFILANINKVVENEVLKFNFSMFKQFITSTEFPMTEETRFQSVCGWVLFNVENRVHNFEELITNLHWKAIYVNSIYRIVQTEPLFAQSDCCMLKILELLDEQKLLLDLYRDNMHYLRGKLTLEHPEKNHQSSKPVESTSQLKPDSDYSRTTDNSRVINSDSLVGETTGTAKKLSSDTSELNVKQRISAQDLTDESDSESPSISTAPDENLEEICNSGKKGREHDKNNVITPENTETRCKQKVDSSSGSTYVNETSGNNIKSEKNNNMKNSKPTRRSRKAGEETSIPQRRERPGLTKMSAGPTKLSAEPTKLSARSTKSSAEAKLSSARTKAEDQLRVARKRTIGLRMRLKSKRKPGEWEQRKDSLQLLSTQSQISDKETPEKATEEGATKTKRRRTLRMKPAEKENKDDIVLCEMCEQESSSESDLAAHLESEHRTQIKHTCDVCKQFSSAWLPLYQRHMRTHFTGPPPFKCDEEGCVQEFARFSALITHRMNSLGARPYECIQCDIKVRTRHNMAAHQRCHTGEKPFTCEICDRSFATKGTLDQHTVKHSTMRPYLCDLCGFSTKYKSHLNSHRRTHTGEVLCCQMPDCDYTTPKRTLFACHMRSHMSIRQFICDVCSRAFIEKGHLVRHERIHLKDKPFKCTLCPYTGSRRDKLKEHMQKYHSDGAVSALSWKPRKQPRQDFDWKPDVNPLGKHGNKTKNKDSPKKSKEDRTKTSKRKKGTTSTTTPTTQAAKESLNEEVVTEIWTTPALLATSVSSSVGAPPQLSVCNSAIQNNVHTVQNNVHTVLLTGKANMTAGANESARTIITTQTGNSGYYAPAIVSLSNGGTGTSTYETHGSLITLDLQGQTLLLTNTLSRNGATLAIAIDPRQLQANPILNNSLLGSTQNPIITAQSAIINTSVVGQRTVNQSNMLSQIPTTLSVVGQNNMSTMSSTVQDAPQLGFISLFNTV